jgi:hypothetical protein
MQAGSAPARRMRTGSKITSPPGHEAGIQDFSRAIGSDPQDESCIPKVIFDQSLTCHDHPFPASETSNPCPMAESLGQESVLPWIKTVRLMGNDRGLYGSRRLSSWATTGVFMDHEGSLHGQRSGSLWTTKALFMGKERGLHGPRRLSSWAKSGVFMDHEGSLHGQRADSLGMEDSGYGSGSGLVQGCMRGRVTAWPSCGRER